MIQDGDRIAVGVSGGKDSLTLLVALRQLKNFLPVKFELKAITLTMGIGEVDLSPVRELCERIDVSYTVKRPLSVKLYSRNAKKKTLLPLCKSQTRRSAQYRQKTGCNKVALAHHMHDVIETFLLSLFYEGRIHTFSPVTYLDRKGLYLIRPLIYTEEKLVKTVLSKQII